jgi:hypothetical protein
VFSFHRFDDAIDHPIAVQTAWLSEALLSTCIFASVPETGFVGSIDERTIVF